MLLNSDQIAEYVTESEYSKRSQIGIDLSVYKIEKINTKSIVHVGHTKIDSKGYKEITLEPLDGSEYWILEPGVYSVTFNEGVKIPSHAAALITHRSSLYRTGTTIKSPWWDPGFECENMNTTMVTPNGILIEKNARLAQISFWECTPPSELYDGQFQGKSTAYK